MNIIILNHSLNMLLILKMNKGQLRKLSSKYDDNVESFLVGEGYDEKHMFNINAISYMLLEGDDDIIENRL